MPTLFRQEVCCVIGCKSIAVYVLVFIRPDTLELTLLRGAWASSSLDHLSVVVSKS